MQKFWRNVNIKNTSAYILVVFLVFVFTSSAYAYSAGIPGNSRTGCNCHGSNADTQTTATINGLPNQYVLGNTYTLTVNVTSTSVLGSNGGFDLSVTAGTLSTTDSNAQIENSEAIHKNNQARVWQVNWTAPTEAGPVSFYIAGLASNGAGALGDKWALNSYTVNAQSGPGPEDQAERMQLWIIQVLIGSVIIIFTITLALGIVRSRKKKVDRVPTSKVE